jgi:hypothetical protein
LAGDGTGHSDSLPGMDVFEGAGVFRHVERVDTAGVIDCAQDS